MKRNILILFILLAILTVPFWTVAPVVAQSGYSAGSSLFSAQCSDIQAATFSDWTQDGAGWTRHVQRELDVKTLVTMRHSEGRWMDYDAVGFEFGRHLVSSSNDGTATRVGQIITQTSCGEFVTRAYETQEGDLLVIVETLPTDIIASTDSCDANGHHCGRHKIAFGYVFTEEWQRVTGESTAAVEIGKSQ